MDSLQAVIAELRPLSISDRDRALIDRLERIDAEMREEHAVELDSLAWKASTVIKELRERLAAAEKSVGFVDAIRAAMAAPWCMPDAATMARYWPDMLNDELVKLDKAIAAEARGEGK